MILIEDAVRVPWRFLIQHNPARARALFTFWMLCHGRLTTKDRLIRSGLINDSICSLCKLKPETMHSVFFNCRITSDIWNQILQRIEVVHNPMVWHNELRWVIDTTKRDGQRAKILKLAFIEAIYGIWSLRNAIVFATWDNSNTIARMFESIIYRGCNSKPIRHHMSRLMVQVLLLFIFVFLASRILVIPWIYRFFELLKFF